MWFYSDFKCDFTLHCSMLEHNCHACLSYDYSSDDYYNGDYSYFMWCVNSEVIK